MKERRGPEQKLKLGHALYEGGLQQNELVPSLTLKRGNWEQNALFLLSCLGGLAPSWICCCDGSPVPACLPQDQGACESGELHLLSRREASVTHLLDRDDVIR